MNVEQVKQQIAAKLNLATAQKDLIESAPCLERCNSIVCFPKHLITIDTDALGKPVMNLGIIAAQFTPEAAAELCEVVSNGHGDRPVIMSPIEYYSAVVEYTQTVLDSFQ